MEQSDDSTWNGTTERSHGHVSFMSLLLSDAAYKILLLPHFLYYSESLRNLAEWRLLRRVTS